MSMKGPRKRKPYKQQSARRNARYLQNYKKRQRVFTWTTTQKWDTPEKDRRTYIILDDKSGNFVSNKWVEYDAKIPFTQHEHLAAKFTSSDRIVKIINKIKHTGAWRTKRIK